ncbi:hypothetical protein [Crocosphaera chwakensis]|uniref:DUF433 domain-containing protein n=1 Tax=Crocosphaera chwakensis CCY0110 TaxID=391612 RepID=A3IUP7_9CHRO|nr:hypothetical protein [Crocosphaera chwakensis]EAZ89839.1 hypothetical protein CY0110_25431 [Crocosphaera chwakensis CCY0110]
MSFSIVTPKQYIEKKELSYRIVGKKISLDSIIYGFLRGKSPETINASFPNSTLEEIYGAITFYLVNREMIDVYLKEGEKLYHGQLQEEKNKDPDFYHIFLIS